MGLHQGVAFYAMCDAGRDEHGRRCPAFVAPPRYADPQGPGAVLVAGYEVFAAAVEHGWLTPTHGERWLCPQHRPKAGG